MGDCTQDLICRKPSLGHQLSECLHRTLEMKGDLRWWLLRISGTRISRVLIFAPLKGWGHNTRERRSINESEQRRTIMSLALSVQNSQHVGLVASTNLWKVSRDTAWGECLKLRDYRLIRGHRKSTLNRKHNSSHLIIFDEVNLWLRNVLSVLTLNRGKGFKCHKGNLLWLSFPVFCKDFVCWTLSQCQPNPQLTFPPVFPPAMY